jgi:DNA polymerase III alpha subunit
MLGTILQDRVLWYDGDSSIDPSDLERFAVLHPNVRPYVLEIDDTVRQYNRFVTAKITKKTNVALDPLRWTIPKEYQTLDVEQYVHDKLLQQHKDDQQLKLRQQRVDYELQHYKKRGLFDMLRVIIYVINTLTSNNQVWGVGRGSSVSSYVLYLIGVHDIDSVTYDIDFHDFLKEEHDQQETI